MKYINLVENMLRLQQELNDATNGIGWENGTTKQGKLISWKRCIYMECAELIDSFAWKHWKSINEPTNAQNIAIEIVDIWHFVMSLFLEDYKVKNRGDISNLANDIALSDGFLDFCKEPFDINDYSIYELVNDAEILINRSSGFSLNLFELLKDYFRLSLKCGVNLEKLFEIYMAKNILNHFRQQNGYKEGTYKKIWNGIEDNVVMSEILSQGINTKDKIYAALQERYSAVK